MGCGATHQAQQEQEVQGQFPEGSLPLASRLADTQSIDHPAQTLDQQFAQLLEESPFVERPEHYLHHYVEQCRKSVEEGSKDEAQDALDNLALELIHEERLIAAAFTKFDKNKDTVVCGVEIEYMMEYLGFPSSQDDVKSFVALLDKDADAAISYSEFICGVGILGGSATLFEVRRHQVEDRSSSITSSFSSVGSSLSIQGLSVPLQACGIDELAQASWEPVTIDSEFVAAAKLVPCQKAAVRHIRALAEVNHERSLPRLLKRANALGFDEADLWIAMAWIRELSPVIIHIDLDLVGDKLKADTHYRNQFQTRTSGGLNNRKERARCEKNLFGPAYDLAKPFERPKYGVLNVWNDYRGVINCWQYGDSYIVLKDVRLRCTLSPRDSHVLTARRLASLDFYAHVFDEYTDAELLSVFNVAKGGQEKLGDSGAVVDEFGDLTYKEAQIHGEIDLEKHVECLVVNERHRPKSKWIEEIASAHGWRFTWMNDMKEELEARSPGRKVSGKTFRVSYLERLQTKAFDKHAATLSERIRR